MFTKVAKPSSATSEGRQMNLNYANRLSRTYALHMETLDKHRGKGQQKVTVKHVHVHEGGQAIVGHVETGGSKSKSGDQCHAQALAHAPEPPLRSPCQDNREALPQRLNGKRPLPDARRESGST
jgi:hypothetical protein